MDELSRFIGSVIIALAVWAAAVAAAAQEKPAAQPPVAKDEAAQDAQRPQPPLTAVLKTARGEIHMELCAGKTPLASASFVNLALRGFYDGLTFDRVIAKTAVEGGCPLGKGIGFPGYKFEDEFDAGLRHDGPGVVSLLNAGPNTNGCRFTITLRAMPSMDDRNTIFARVTSGMEAVRKLEPGDRIDSITVLGDPAPLLRRMEPRLAEWNKVLDEKFPGLKPAPAIPRETQAPNASPAPVATPPARPDAPRP